MPCISVTIDLETMNILWWALDGVLFLAAMSAYAIAQAEKKAAQKQKYGRRK